jgi:hypothetical protein
MPNTPKVTVKKDAAGSQKKVKVTANGKTVAKAKNRGAIGKALGMADTKASFNMGGKTPPKTYSSPEAAARAKLEGEIAKVKGTPAATPLVKKYRATYGGGK